MAIDPEYKGFVHPDIEPAGAADFAELSRALDPRTRRLSTEVVQSYQTYVGENTWLEFGWQHEMKTEQYKSYVYLYDAHHETPLCEADFYYQGAFILIIGDNDPEYIRDRLAKAKRSDNITAAERTVLWFVDASIALNTDEITEEVFLEGYPNGSEAEARFSYKLLCSAMSNRRVPLKMQRQAVLEIGDWHGSVSVRSDSDSAEHEQHPLVMIEMKNPTTDIAYRFEEMRDGTRRMYVSQWEEENDDDTEEYDELVDESMADFLTLFAHPAKADVLRMAAFVREARMIDAVAIKGNIIEAE